MMFKKILRIFCLLVSAALLFSGCSSQNSRSSANQSADHVDSIASPSQDASGSSTQNNGVTVVNHYAQPVKLNKYRELSPAQLVQLVVTSAKKGQVPGSPFTVGKTSIQQVEQQWGKPKDVTKTKEGLYDSYKSRHVDVGYKQGEPAVFDLRTSDKVVQSIKLSTLKKVMGKADEVRYYKDQNVNQEILVYNLNGVYQLKWVMPKPVSANPDPEIDHISVVALAGGNDILNKMTLDEKIGQMMMVGIKGTQAGSFVKNGIKNEHFGGVILYSRNISDVPQTVQLIDQLKKMNQSAGNPLPLFISADQEGGSVQRMPSVLKSLPSNGNVGKIDDPHYSYEVGSVIGEEMSAFGFNMDYAPVLDINKSGANSVIGDRSFGSNPKVVAQLGVATMKGIQSKGVISVVKHFPGYGVVGVDAHKDLPVVHESMSQLLNVEWYPYKQAIANGADAVMVTHMVIPNLDPNDPASMSKTIISGMLREKLGFDGVVITDDMTMGAIEKHYAIGKAAVQSVKAGADIVMVAFNEDQQMAVFKALKQAVEDGQIPVERINQSVSRIIRLKEKYDLTNSLIEKVNVNQLNHDLQSIQR